MTQEVGLPVGTHLPVLSVIGRLHYQQTVDPNHVVRS